MGLIFMLFLLWLFATTSSVTIGGLWIVESIHDPTVESCMGLALGCSVVAFTTLANLGPLFGILPPGEPVSLWGAWICVAVCLVRTVFQSRQFAMLLYPSLVCALLATAWSW